jgi:LPS export ABC transporter protein LptC
MKYLTAIFFFIVLITGCGENKLQPQVENNVVGELPTQESWDSKIIFSDEGKLKAVVYADHLSVYEDKQITFLNGVKILFYNSKEKNTSTLTSKKGKVDDKTNDMYAIDSVVAVNDSGVTLTTDELVWKNNQRKITTDKFVTITTPDEKIQGYGFESDQQLENYTIYNITYSTTLKKVKNEK